MEIKYKGWTLDAHRGESLGGDNLLYYSAFDETGCERISNFSYGSDTVREMIGYMKNYVDEAEKEKEKSS